MALVVCGTQDCYLYMGGGLMAPVAYSTQNCYLSAKNITPAVTYVDPLEAERRLHWEQIGRYLQQQ